MKGWTMEDVERARARLAGKGVVVAPLTRPEGSNGQARGRKAISIVKESGPVKGKSPNKTESAYNREFLGGRGIFEGITFHLAGGSRYTIDWYLFENGVHTVVEVKGSYRFGSQGRAWTAWREARAQFPGFNFVWAERQKDGTWKDKE